MGEVVMRAARPVYPPTRGCRVSGGVLCIKVYKWGLEKNKNKVYILCNYVQKKELSKMKESMKKWLYFYIEKERSHAQLTCL